MFHLDSERLSDDFKQCGDLSIVIREALDKMKKKKASPASTISIVEVDEWLDDLSRLTRESDQQELLEAMARR